MPDKVHRQFVGIGSLSTMVTKVAFEMALAVFANYRHI
jgi:hypothetical protein